MNANALTPATAGQFTAAGPPPASFIPARTPAGFAPCYMSASGTFVGTIQLQRSFDGGQTWVPAGTASAAPSLTAPGSIPFVDGSGALYGVACTAFTSGTINFRIDQNEEIVSGLSAGSLV